MLLIVVVTEIQAAGKSTVAQALAQRLERSVHLRGDLFRRMVVNGRAEIGPAAAHRGARPAAKGRTRISHA